MLRADNPRSSWRRGKHSLLIDAGFPAEGGWESPCADPAKARDANRILAAAHDAGITRIDHLLVTHFHQDHDGGVPELAQLLPIREFIDHDSPSPNVESTVHGASAAYIAYERTRRGKDHRVPKPGDRLQIGGLYVTFLTSAAKVISSPLETATETSENCAHW